MMYDYCHDKTITNEHGGKQSHVEGRYDLIPATALQHAAELLGYGAQKYGEYNWTKIPFTDHLNHALAHLVALQRNTELGLPHGYSTLQEDDLAHAMVRLMFAIHQRAEEAKNYSSAAYSLDPDTVLPF
jgi:hypothetical protein